MATEQGSARPGTGANVPPEIVHTGTIFVAAGIVGVVVLAAGVIGAVTGPGANEIPGWAGLAIVVGVLAAVVGLIAGPSAVRIGRRDVVTLALVRANRPGAVILPGAGSNGELIRSLNHLGYGPTRPKSYLWSADATGLGMWQFDAPGPVFTLGWKDIESMETGSMTQGRATIAVARLSLSSGRTLTIALRRRFGGITLMGQDRLHAVLETFDTLSRGR